MEGYNLLELMGTRRDAMQIAFDTHTEHISVNVFDELKIDVNDLDTELAALPSQVAYWIGVLARFELVVSEIKREYDNWYAPIYDSVFNDLERQTGRRPNINSVEYMVRKNYSTEYNEKQVIVTQADSDFKIVAGVVEGLRVKMQSLIQLAKRITEADFQDNLKFGNDNFSQRTPYVRERMSSGMSSSTNQAVDEAKNAMREIRRKGSES